MNKHLFKINSRRIGGRNFVTTAYKSDSPEDTLVAEVKELITEVKGKSKESKEIAESAKLAAKAAEDQAKEAKEQTRVLKESIDAKAEAERANQEALNGLLLEMKQIREKGAGQQGKIIGFKEAFQEGVKENFDSIQKASKGHKAGFEIKAGANMTTTTDLTGSPNITYIPQPALLPAQKVNFRSLVNTFQSQTGVISLFRENSPAPAVGAFGKQATQGALKEQVEYQYTNVTYNAVYLSGFVRVSKQMLQDLLFLQTYLPQELLRDYYKFENQTFFTDLSTAATGSTTTSGGNTAEKLIDYITNIETNNFGVNGIVVPPAIWGAIMKTRVPTTGTSYSVPGGFYINPQTGNVEIAGVPVIKATWMPAGTALVGDWTQAQVAYVDNLRVEFFEQDSDNVQRNLITVRVECRCVLVVERPEAFVYATGLS